MKSVLISIRPEWCELIVKGEKSIELRKTRPNIETPFKCYIYCTKNDLLTKSHLTGEIYVATDKRYQQRLEDVGNLTLSGKVIGEFVCDRILPIMVKYSDPSSKIALREFPFTCLTDKQIIDYLGNGKQGYGWHISDLMIYDKPKELCEFAGLRQTKFGLEPVILTRPPQSWCYVSMK